MGDVKKGTMRVGIQETNGVTLTKEYGFTIEEGDQDLMAFDYFSHPDYGKVLLVNHEVLFLKFWKTEDIKRLQRLVNDATNEELRTRTVA